MPTTSICEYTPEVPAGYFTGGIASIAWIVADWMVREKKSDAWAEVKKKLGGERAPRSMVTRLLARVGPDDPGMWMEGLWRAGEIEIGRIRK